MQTVAKDFWQTNYDEKFMKIADSLCALMAKEGVHVRPYVNGLPHFSRLADNQKDAAITHLQFQYDLCMEQITEGYSLKDSPSFTWRALRKLGYTPTSDLFEQITDDHVIEVYSKDSVQVFRNLNFFQFCSYTFEEILSLEWWNLFDRSEAMSQKIFDATVKVFSGECRVNFDPEVPNHFVRETQSADRLTMEFTMQLIGPLFQNKEPRAVICLEKVRLLNN